MLPKDVHASTELLAQAAVRRAWVQWSAIGATTLHAPKPEQEIVDIEALLLGSLGLAARVPRLRTLATDWTLENSRLLSIARLRALLTGPFAQTGVNLEELAERALFDAGDARWRALLPNGPSHDRARRRSDKAVRKAMPPRWRGAQTLMLQLRRGFGIGVKPDVLAILLGSGDSWLDVSTLAELSGYTVSAIRLAADDMASAALVESSGSHGRAYRADLKAWTLLFPKVGAPSWRRRADGFSLVLRWLAKTRQTDGVHHSAFDLALAFAALVDEYDALKREAGITREPSSDDLAQVWPSRHESILALVQWFGGTE
jgi:hypothetical protein